MAVLMGSSGAGKTTLIGRGGREEDGGVRSRQLHGGRQRKTQSRFTKCTGYAEQFGCHAAAATVFESLEFSANVRLSKSVSEHQRIEMVETIMETLELRDIGDALAGVLSME
jgi:ABC-type multidrug transport system ATPase subunit